MFHLHHVSLTPDTPCQNGEEPHQRVEESDADCKPQMF